MGRYVGRAAALAAAIAAAGAGFSSSTANAATATWIDPADPTGLGTDPNAATNLNGNYNDSIHWSAGVPSDVDNAVFSAPGYPFVAYSVAFAQDTFVNTATIMNDPVTFNMAGAEYIALQTAVSQNNAALFVADNSSLTVKNGFVFATNIQLGSASGTEAHPTFLAVDGSAGTTDIILDDGGNLTNYQEIDIKGGGTFFLGNSTLLTQSPDFSTTGNNTGQIVITGVNSSISLADGATISGGAIHLNDGFVGFSGSSATFDSLLFDGDLNVSTANFTLNLTSNQVDAGSNLIPTTITGNVFVSQGTLNISGSVVQVTPDNGTTWNNFFVFGSSTALIQNAELTTADFNLDGNPGAVSTSTVNISGSLVTNHGDFYVATLGHTTLNVTAAGSILTIDGALVLGYGEAGNGTVLISGPSGISTGNDITNSNYGTGDLVVGRLGVGNMTIAAGASVTVDNGGWGFVGQDDNGDGTGGNGTLTVDGAALDGANVTVPSSLGISNGELFIGDNPHSRGTLNITNGGFVFDNDGHIGGSTSSTGTVIVDGSFTNTVLHSVTASEWLNNGFIVVGDGGTGNLTIRNGGVVSDTVGDIGSGTGSSGTVLVDNATWTNSSFISVGDNGSASLTIQNHATVTATILSEASVTGGSGVVIVNNAALTLSDFLSVGEGATGNFQIQNGANVSAGSSITLGDVAGGNGTLVADGNTTKLSEVTFTTIGNSGEGSLTIQNGATFTNGGGAFIGAATGGQGNATVTGNHSLWSIANGLEVGGAGNGNLTVQSGAIVNVTNSIFIGALATSTNSSVLVTGAGSQLNSTLQFVVGSDGTGNVTISGGGVITCFAGASPTGSAGGLGQEGTSNGTLTISGAGSELISNGHFNIGIGNNGAGNTNGGHGTLIINAGGLLTSVNGYVGRYAGSTGNVTIGGTSAAWQNSGSFFLAANDTANNPSNQTLAAGAGNVTLNIGGTLSAAVSALVGPSGNLTLNGGNFSAPTITSSGIINGIGTLTGNLTSSGIVSVLTGTISITGNYTQIVARLFTGNGTLVANALFGNIATVSGTLRVRSNGTNTGTSKLNSLTVAGSAGNWTGSVDLTNNKLIVEDSATHATTLATLNNQATYAAAHANSGGLYASGQTTGKQLIILDNAVEGLSTFGGTAIDAGSILAMAAFPGDANLDGQVNISDLNIVAAHWQQSTSKWTFGDFNGDGVVNIADLNVVAAHWQAGAGSGSGESLTPAIAAPEPASLLVLAAASIAHLMARRRFKA